MSQLETIEIKAFIPAKDFDLSKRFYEDLGFTVASSDGAIAYLHHGNSSFLLQNFYEKALAENLMMHLLVRHVDAWWQHVVESKLAEKYGVRVEPVALRPWHMRDFVIVDPSGVLWRITENTESEPRVAATKKPCALQEAVPILSVDDLKTSLDYYQRVLGFRISWTWGEPPYLVGLCRDQVSLNLGVRGKAGPVGSSHVYFQVSGVEDFYRAVSDGQGTVTVALGDRPYGMKDFGIRDPSGNDLHFGEAHAG